MIDSAHAGGRFAFARTLAITMGLVILPLFGLTFFWGYQADQNHVSRVNRYLGEVELGMRDKVAAVWKMFPAPKNKESKVGGAKRNDSNKNGSEKHECDKNQPPSDAGIPGITFQCVEIAGNSSGLHPDGLQLLHQSAVRSSGVGSAADSASLNCDLEIKSGQLDSVRCKSAKADAGGVRQSDDDAGRSEVAALIPWPSLLPKRVLESGIEQLLLADSDGRILSHFVPPDAPDERELRDQSPHPFQPIPVGLVHLPAELLGTTSTGADPANSANEGKSGLSFTKSGETDLLSNPTLRINGQRYRLFVRAIALQRHPFHPEAAQSETRNVSDQAEGKLPAADLIYLVALERAGGLGPISFRLDAKARLSLLVLALVLLLALPLIKLLLTHASDGLGRWHARWLMLSMFGLAALVSILLCAWSRLESTHSMLQQTAKASAESIAAGLKSEVAKVSNGMLDDAKIYLGVNCPPTEDDTVNEKIQVGNGKYTVDRDCASLDSFEDESIILSCAKNSQVFMFPERLKSDRKEKRKTNQPAVVNIFAVTRKGELTDQDGKLLVPVLYSQQIKDLPRDFNISTREYLRRSLLGEGAQLAELAQGLRSFADQRIVVQRLRNLLDARITTQIATRCGSIGRGVESSPRVLSADVLLTSAERPILPLNLQFSVFDLRTGMVLFHSDSERVLIEDLFRELDDDRRLAAAARAREPDAFWADYRGERAWFAFEPVVPLNWGVIVYAPSDPVDGLFYAIVLTAIGLSFLCLVLLASWLQTWLWANRLRGAALFWPQWRLRQAYLPLALLLPLISLGAGFWSEHMPEPVLALVVALLLTLYCLVAAITPHPKFLTKPYWRVSAAASVLLGMALWTICSAPGNLTERVLLLLPMIVTLAPLLWIVIQNRLTHSEEHVAAGAIPLNIWRTPLNWKVPAWMQRAIDWFTGGAAKRWSAFSFRYTAFLSAFCLAFAAIPAWFLCDFAYQNWRMDTELFLEQATQIQQKLRYEYLLNQRNQLVKSPYHPGMFDAIRGRWEQGIHPRCPDDVKEACRFGAFQSFKVADEGPSQNGLSHLIWPNTAAEVILPPPRLPKESRRRVFPAEASSWLRQFKNWVVPGHPVPLTIAALGAQKVDRGIPTGPASWDEVYGKNRSIAYQLPTPAELRQQSAGGGDVRAGPSLAPIAPLFGVLALFVLFRLLDAQLLGSWLLWSGRLGPSGPPGAECSDNDRRFKLMIRANRLCREELSRDCQSKDCGLYEIDVSHHPYPSPFPDKPIWVDGLDVAIRADPKHRQGVLSALEEFVARPGGHRLWIATDSPPLHFISRPEAYPASASLTEPVCLSERVRWARLFAQFAKCYPQSHAGDPWASQRMKARQSDAKTAELIDRETRLFWPEMLGLRGLLFARCAEPEAVDRPLNERDVIEAVEMEFGAMMRRHWETLTTQERLLMKQLADGCYANPGNRLALLHLLRRGLLVSEPFLTVKTEALRLFVQTAETQDQYDAWQAQTPESAWSRFRAPILVGLVLLLGITGWITRDATQLITSLVGALTGALSLFSRAVGGGKFDVPK